jgi:hypothetical protein
MAYAESTTVSVEKSRAEIEKMLNRYGATKTMFGIDNDNGHAIIQFEANNRQIRFKLSLPKVDERRFATTHGGSRAASPVKRRENWEQACRQKWRALCLSIKAKFEAIEAGIDVFENEFLANIVVDGMRTVSDVVRPQIAQAYATNKPSGIAGFLS